MKTPKMILTAAALLLGYSSFCHAFACPQLVGRFTCTNSDGTTEAVTVTQYLKDKVTVYHMNNMEVISNNQTYPIDDSDTLKSASYRAWCDDDVTLKVFMTGKIYGRDTYYGDIELNMNYLMDGTSLKLHVSGVFKSGSQDQPINNELSCLPN